MAENLAFNETRGWTSRPIISIAAGFVLTAISFVASDHLPELIALLLNIPAAIICNIDRLVRTPPADDAPILEAGRDALCYFVSVLLNIPFYSMIAFALLTLRARRKRKATESKSGGGNPIEIPR